MALTLARGETILYPMPYVEAERPPYVVTNQRLIERTEMGERVLPVKSLIGAGRARSRPFAATGVFLICLGLATAAAGAYFYVPVIGMEAAPWKALLPSSSETEEPSTDDETPPAKLDPPPAPEEMPDDPSAERPDDAAWRLTVLKTRATGMALFAAGFLFGMIGLRAFAKRRFFVVCRTRDAMMRIQVDGKVQQDIILATLQAVA